MNNSFSMLRARGLATSLVLVALLCACGGDNPDAMLASARDYMAKSDPKAAVIQLKNALQKNPDIPEARYLLGLALFRNGDFVGSETELRKALALKHPPELVVPLLAQALLAQRQYKKLTDEFARTELGPNEAKADLHTSLFAAYSAQGNSGMAKAALSDALAADATYAPALLVQGREKAAAGEADAALIPVESVLSKTPGNYEALKLKGDILFYGKNQPDEALAAYKKSIDAKADFLAGHAAILMLLQQQGKLGEAGQQLAQLKKVAANHPQTKYFEALLAYRRNDLKLAREMAQQLIKMAPTNFMSLQLAGLIEFQSNSLLQAEGYLVKATQADPQAASARRLLATTYLRLGQPAKALTTLQPILKSDKLDAATGLIAGEVYLANGDSAKAAEFFSMAAKQDPKNTTARTSLALTHLESGKDQMGFGELQDIAASDSGTSADMALITAHLRRNDLVKALAAIDKLEKKQPGKPLAADLRGRTLQVQGDMAGARKSFERALTLDSAYFPSLTSLAALDLAEKKPDDARKRYEAILAKDPKNVQALLAVANLRARAGAGKDEVAELVTRAVNADPSNKLPRLFLVELYLRKKDFKQGLSVAQSAVAAIPDSPELLDALGRAQQLSGDGNQAIITFNKVAAMQALSPMPQMRLAEAYLMSKDNNAAVQSLRKALDIKPDLLDAQKGLIKLSMDANNYAEATTVARTVQKQRPKESIGYLFEADIAASQKKWDAAVDVLRSGLKQGAFPDLAIKLDVALAASGKTAEQEKFVAAWLKDNPKDIAFRAYRGDLALVRKDYQRAEKIYRDVLQIQPNSAMALNNLAWITSWLGKDGAIAYAEKANTLAPNQPLYMDTLAMLLSDKNEYARAAELQTKAIELQPQNDILKLDLAKIHIKGGKKDLARKQLDELAKLGTKFPAQPEVANLLKTL